MPSREPAARPKAALVTALGLAACGAPGASDTIPTDELASAEAASAAEPAVAGVTPTIALPSGATRFAVETGVEVELGLRLASPTGEPVAVTPDLDVDPFDVRLPGGRIESVPADASGAFRYTFARPGTAVVAMCARAEGWTSCSKSVVTATGGQPGRMLTDVTAKAGTPVELRPLKDDRLYRTGVGLPVRAYLDGHKAKGATIVAHRPDGSTVTRTADKTGTATLDLDQPGPWVVRFADELDGHHYRAELAFSVAGEVR